MNKLRFRWAYSSRAETRRGRGGFDDGGRVCVDKVLHETALFVQSGRGGVLSRGWRRHRSEAGLGT
jgi:hypothetical protein